MLLGTRHVPERLCGGLDYLERYNKCSPLPILTTILDIDVIEVCPMNKSDHKSQNFIMDRFLMKLFKTVNIEISSECYNVLVFALPARCHPREQMQQLLVNIMPAKIYCVRCVATS